MPVVARASDWLLARPAMIRTLGWANVALGVALGIYTGILLNTMVARPLWNSAILGPLFLVSGLSAGAALVHLATTLLPGRPAPQGLVAGALAALWQPIGQEAPPRHTANELTRADLAFLAIELVLIGLLLANLYTSTASHSAAASLIASGPYALAFWGVVVGARHHRPAGAAGTRARAPHSTHRPARAAGARRRLHPALGDGPRRPALAHRAGEHELISYVRRRQ